MGKGGGHTRDVLLGVVVVERRGERGRGHTKDVLLGVVMEERRRGRGTYEGCLAWSGGGGEKL